MVHLHLLRIQHELGKARAQPAFEPPRRVEDVVRAREEDGLHGHARLVRGLRIHELRPRGHAARPPRQPVAPRELPDHEVHQTDLGGAGHRRPALHVHGGEELPVDHRGAGAHELRERDPGERLGIELSHRADGARRGARPRHHERGGDDRLVVRCVDLQRVEHRRIPDQGRVAVQHSGQDRVVGDEVVAERDPRHRDRILGSLSGSGRTHERLVRMLEQAVHHVQVALRHRDVHRLADDAAGEVHGRGEMRKLVERVQVFEGAVAAPVVEVEHERGAVGRHEHHVAPADGDASLRIAGGEGERLRRLRDQFHEQRAIDAHAVTVDVGARLLPVRDRLVVAEVDADLFEDSHRGIVDPFDTFLVEHFVIGQREFERRQHRRRRADPHAMPGRAASIPGSSSSHGNVFLGCRPCRPLSPYRRRGPFFLHPGGPIPTSAMPGSGRHFPAPIPSGGQGYGTAAGCVPNRADASHRKIRRPNGGGRLPARGFRLRQ